MTDNQTPGPVTGPGAAGSGDDGLVPGDNGTVDLSILHRLRTDIPESEFLPDPPPVPQTLGQGLDDNFALRTADPDRDAEMVSRWMKTPELEAAWEQPWEPERWAADWRAKLSTTYSVPVIVSYNGRDVGYMEIYRPHRDEIGKIYRSDPHDFGWHVAVGDASLTSRGIFGPFLQGLTRALVDADPLCRLVIVEPDASNVRVHHGLRAFGAVDAGEWQQRADRRVRLFLWPERGEVAENRLYERED
ncbi:GNAT family N-acetyltransferase [Corynebacterium provencense]|uniref:GNAT family N-acetyltransferase n=1 Tax=Corynebacterium provencense TaxID=1737425 RepID=UPI0011CC1A87|nr:GNAT family N-acetyltransferase [Corynebacterium provencense]